MRLSWRDAAAAVPVAAAVGLYLAHRAEIDLPVLSGPRVAAAVIFILGVTACSVGGGMAQDQPAPPRDPWLRALGLHGIAAFLITVIALITGSWGVVATLVALLVLMWLATTLHRLLAPRKPMPASRSGHAHGRPPRPA
jgi:hypothetical protein